MMYLPDMESNRSPLALPVFDRTSGLARWLSLGVAAVITALATSSPASAAQLIMFEQDHCPWCERWHAEIGSVYAKTPEGKRAPIRAVDIHARLPADLAHLKPGRFTPTFVLLSEEGAEVDRIRGYPGDEFFWGLLTAMLDKLPAEVHNDAAEGAAPIHQGDQ